MFETADGVMSATLETFSALFIPFTNLLKSEKMHQLFIRVS